MNDEDLLRTGMQTLVVDQPPIVDRVGPVRVRVRRRARRRAAAAGGVLAAAALVAGVLALPGGADRRDSLPARPTESDQPVRGSSYLVPITQLRVTLPAQSYLEQSQRVAGVLDAIPDLPGRLTHPDGDGLVRDGRQRPADELISFRRPLTAAQELAVRDAFVALDGAGTKLDDVDGWDLELVATMTPEVLAELPEGSLIPDLGPASDLNLLYAFGVTRDGDDLAVSYAGGPLTDRVLDRVRREVARVAGVRLSEVRLRRGLGDTGSSYDAGSPAS